MMSTSDSEITAMEDRHAVEEDKSLLSAPPAFVPSSSPSFIATTGPDLTTVSILESKAISMANNDCSSTMSLPAEAGPAKPAETSTSVFEDTFDQSPATSYVASASDSLKCSEMNGLNIADFLPWSSALSTTFGGPELKEYFPPVLTFKGVSVTLENNNIWKQFSECGTEMILTKNGRRMFPYCRYRLSGLDPDRMYSLVLSIVPSGQFKYRWATSKWEVSGATEHQNQGLIRAFSHHFSPSRGSEWMNSLVSFYKLKLTNNFQDQDGHIILHSMHRYIPRLHVIPVPDEESPTAEKPVVIGPESMTFTFPQTEFMAVTTYQNFRITQLKINHNPFAKGFREDGHNSRLYRVSTPVMKVDIQPEDLNPAEPSEHKVMESSTASVNASLSSTTPETRLVLQPIMSDLSVRGVSYVPCIRGKHALGEIVLLHKHPGDKPDEESSVTGTHNVQLAPSITPGSSTSTPVSTRPYHKKRRRKVKRRWGINCRPRMWKAAATADSTAAASPTVAPSPSLTVAMQPELDDIEGLLFASFTTKEALEFHVRDMPATVSSKESPVSSARPTESQEMMEANPETVEEKMVQLESLLLNDLSVFKHRQVIHPVLQEVGLKLSALDPTMPIDLNYLGVCLPLPSPFLPEQSSTAPSSADEGLPFISRTGKTSDMTKIKGWRNKFTKSHETSASNCNESPKNLSAFCSNMLDEYLESEAQQISDRAAAFSLNLEDSVSYQLPAKSSSYVKTLDSVLKHRNGAFKIPERPCRPCPLSRKPLLYSSLRSQASHLSSPQRQNPAEPQSRSSVTHPDSSSGCSYNSYTSQRLLTNQAGICNTSAQRLGQDQVWPQNASNLFKDQFKLSFLETGALNQGLSRTQLTPERLTTALSAVLTNQTPPHQLLSSPPLPPADAGPECGQEFCRLGCVCSSLQHREKERVHCKRPECMFDCTCSDITTHMEPTAQSRLGFSATKLWKLNTCDPDPDSLNVPKSQKSLVPPKVPKRCASNPPPPIREEDKDPVYRYLESKMTCARVRAVNSQPPPLLTLESELSAANLGPKDATKPLNLSHNVSKNRPVLISYKAEGQCSQENAFSEKETRKQIQIRSLCQWKRDRKMVLEGLCERMNRNRLCQRFFIGPYCIVPVTKVTLQKPSGSLITYRVQISKPTHVSDCEAEDNSEYDYNSDESVDAEEEDELVEDPELWYGVTPFLRGAVPAGSLSARKRPIGYKATGLVEVNGKHYNYARLALGNIGSLHPANRLAAYVIGRLPGPSRLSQTGSQNQGSVIKTNAARSVPANAASTGVPPAGTEKTQKTSLQPAVEMLQTLKASSLSGPTQNSLTPLYPVQLLVPVQHDFQNSSTSLSSSLTVSPSLKNPPFLGQSGTYSFRICPPSNQTVGGQKLPGVVLPGGFTLIELPKSKAGEATQEAKPPPATETDSAAQKKEAASNLSHLAKDWVGFDTLSKARKLLSSSPEPGSSSGPISDEKVPTGENGEVDSRQTPSQESFDFSSEELSSDFSVEEFDDETVDVETVEEGKERKVIAKMKEDALKNPRNTRTSTNDSGSSKEPGSLAENKNLLSWRWNHKTLEKQRRSEQKALLNKLQKILRSPSRTSLNHLLSMAIKEIQVLTETSRCLEEEKEKLIKEQMVYVHKLSIASGKYKVLIQKKLKEIFERQKKREKDMKWKPVFSQMLQTKAALLEATAPTSHLQPLPLHQLDYEPPTRAQQLTTAQKKLLMLLTLLHPGKAVDHGSDQVSGQQSSSQAASLSGQAVTVPPSQTGSRHGEPPSTTSQEASGDTDPATLPYCLTNDQAPQTQNGPVSSSSAANVMPPQLLSSLPLIRSKTGRLILPSSLKPIGQGFYTLMVMDSKQKIEEDEASSSANVQPSDGNSSKSLEGNVFPPDQPSDLENKAGTSDSNPRPPGGTTPLGELDLHSQSVVAPSLDVNSSETKQDLDLGLIQPAAAAHLCFNQVSHLPPPSDDFKPDSSPPVGCCRSSGPMEVKSPPVGAGKQNETDKSIIYITIPPLLVESKSDNLTVETKNVEVSDAPNKASDDTGCPAPAKRRRGRPPKKRRANSQTPSAKRASSDDKSPVRFSTCGLNSTKSEGEAYTSRPLTRGSLGKDFPSAKKRSWIDVEKELEPDMEYA